MTENLSTALIRLRGLNYWTIAIVLAILALAAYYSAMGVRYFQARDRTYVAELAIENLRLTDLGFESRFDEHLDEAMTQQIRFRSYFQHSSIDNLTADLAELYSSEGLKVESVIIGEFEETEVSDFSLVSRTVVIVAKGSIEQILAAASLSVANLPTGSIEGFTVTDLETDPLARVRYLFYFDQTRDSGSPEMLSARGVGS